MTDVVKSFIDINEADLKSIGAKAANLVKALQYGLPVPNGFVVTLAAFNEGHGLTKQATQLIQNHINIDKLYAVRSSALAEDAAEASWAGQFETFLNTDPGNLLVKIVDCHNSAKNRALAYAEDKTDYHSFEIAVIVQEMIAPEYAGVLFTKDPVSSENKLLIEYVDGLGEELVSGRVDPKHAELNSNEATLVPFDTTQLVDLAHKVEQLFKVPQDIEWAFASNKVWLIQARPITATQKAGQGHNIGSPSELFYWGPSRAEPLYMSDFMAGIEQFFSEISVSKELPSPPNCLVLFDEGKMVWLSKADVFFDWCESVFDAYERLSRLNSDLANWRIEAQKMTSLKGQAFNQAATRAWYFTEFAEIALYGSETALAKRLERFDTQTRQDIWRAFTVPDKPTFMSRIDQELAKSQNPTSLAKKYAWIEDGYHGLSDNAESYFKQRLKVVANDRPQIHNHDLKRQQLSLKFKLSRQETNSLSLARKLAEFMDERKAWMMQTRKQIKQPVGTIESGWFYRNGKVQLIGKDATHELWLRYVDFKAASSELKGIVASNGGKHFVNGEVVIVSGPNDTVREGKIVVVASTSPSYVPLMRKAKALVTDHGGMMAHASIVAREFNLPCIVGTKQATKILKTGDKVILDLVTGEVILGSSDPRLVD